MMAAMKFRDRNDTLVDVMKDRQEQQHLVGILQERKQKLESLQMREVELLKEAKKAKDLLSSFNTFPKEQDADENMKKAEKERKEASEKETEVKMLQEEYAHLQHRKQQLLHHMHRDTVYKNFMKQVVKITQFEDEASLAGQLESLLRIREQLCEKQRQDEEQVDHQRKTLLAFNSQHHLMLLHNSNQLSQLHRKLERAQPEVEHWETMWKHIQDTAAKETLLLGLIKMATLNLYESTGGDVEGEKGVALGDTETQLDKIKMFIQDHKDIVKLHQSTTHSNNTEHNTVTL
ncbi:coiled-coil domain-containing protein 42 like-2 [Nerophis lumbriciformis]|uniref:coiled-coil domain-containing protein 42 like-2 n=1 Tax=Nerophis lumbriciformis TaxID=546530 RepID=UPI002ADF83EE|nr:coiled-coil domain-containing protein 42 like-2-like [Nerophis lumbriciformis]XP_061841796.1 coiled-coil domain-containing protein 42 like-2-like [Nerophis lumbriciformis]